MRWLLTLVFVFSVSSIAVEQDTPSIADGNHLLVHCQAALDSQPHDSWKDYQEAYDTGFCLGIVEGVGFADPTACIPNGVTIGQELRVVVKLLNDNPAKLQLDERILVHLALSNAFPCRKPQPPAKKK